jgi:hypothetical protein
MVPDQVGWLAAARAWRLEADAQLLGVVVKLQSCAQLLHANCVGLCLRSQSHAPSCRLVLESKHTLQQHSTLPCLFLAMLC